MAFLNDLVAFFYDNGVMPAEITASSTDREGTYLQYLPDSPNNAWCAKVYATDAPALAGKQSGVVHVQIIARNESHGTVFNSINTLWQFLLNRPEFIEDFEDYFVIFAAQSGPIPTGRDEQGNYLYTLNFPVTTKLY